jgi:hypothetical protein
MTKAIAFNGYLCDDCDFPMCHVTVTVAERRSQGLTCLPDVHRSVCFFVQFVPFNRPAASKPSFDAAPLILGA